MVVRQILALNVRVRILAGQQNIEPAYPALLAQALAGAAGREQGIMNNYFSVHYSLLLVHYLLNIIGGFFLLPNVQCKS